MFGTEKLTEKTGMYALIDFSTAIITVNVKQYPISPVGTAAQEMIITGAENVYPIEIENVLSQHPAVAACAVFGLPDDFWGETVHAVVRSKAGIATDEATLIEHCRSHLAHYKCPRTVSFRSEAMPLSSSNKIDKSALRQSLLNSREISTITDT